jgi:hypothetical protein
MVFSPRDTVTSEVENGVHIRKETRILKTWLENAEMRGFAGSGKNSENAKVSLASPRKDDG